MKQQFVSVWWIVSMCALSACSAPCEGFEGERPASWAAHPDLVPRGGIVCRASETTATIDFEGVDSPVGHTVEHLEGAGWTRRTPVGESATLERGAETLRVDRVAGRPRVTLGLL